MSSKDRSLRVDGVITRHSDFGEADRLLTIFTREIGKVRVIAKGVRKPRSRKAGHVQPYTRSSLQLARGRDLFILTQAETINGYTALREDLILLGYTSYIIELIDQSTIEEEENRSIYNLLIRTLNRLNRGDSPNLVVRYFEIRLLDFIGFRPQLYVCTRCESEILPQNQYFSAQKGGVICPNCWRHDSETRPISMYALKYFRYFQRSSYQKAARASISEAVYSEMETLIQFYITVCLERGLNSPAFLRRMRNEGK